MVTLKLALWSKIRFYFIPEQFTVKAHPALFEEEGGGEGEGQQKVRNTFIPVYIHIHIQTAKARTLCVYMTIFALFHLKSINAIFSIIASGQLYNSPLLMDFGLTQRRDTVTWHRDLYDIIWLPIPSYVR